MDAHALWSLNTDLHPGEAPENAPKEETGGRLHWERESQNSAGRGAPAGCSFSGLVQESLNSQGKRSPKERPGEDHREHTMQYADDVLQNCTSETYTTFITNGITINLIKLKNTDNGKACWLWLIGREAGQM